MVYTSGCEKCLNLLGRDVMNTIGSKQAVVPGHDEIDLASLFHHIMVNKWFVLVITLMFLIFGAFYVHRQVPQYQSDVLLQVEMGHSMAGGTGFADQLALGGIGASGGASVQTQMALIQSRFILAPVIHALGLDIRAVAKKGSFWERLFPRLASKKTIQIKSFHVPKEKINQAFLLYFDKPGHIRLFDSSNQLILQGPIGSMISNHNRTIGVSVGVIHAPIGSYFYLAKRSNAVIIQSILSRLKIAESGAGRMVQGTGILNLSLTGDDPTQLIRILNAIAKIAREKDAQKKSQEALQTLDFLYHQLPLAKHELENAEHRLNLYRAQSGKIDIKLQTQFLLNQLSSLDKKIDELRIDKIDMLQKYTKVHPAFIALDTQTKALDSQRQKLERLLKTLPASDQIAVNLLREVTVKQTLYLILLNKIQELQVMKAGTVSGIRILAKATIPDAPLPGKHAAIYLGSFFLGILCSLMVIFSRRLLSPRVDDPHWIERHYNLPSLAIIPYCKEQTVAEQLLDRTKQIPLLAQTNPRNLSIESLRSLRTSLQVSLAGANNNIVSILGVSPSVGKSFVSANLAYLLATAGKRVLLIDADLRRGTIHKYLNIPASPGLADVLNDTFSIDAALFTSPVDNLTCLPRGSYPQDPSELLMSPRFKVLLTTLSEKYDVVVIDTAPVLLVTDAVLVGGLSGTNYIVFGAGAHQPADIEIALKRLMSAGVHLHGSIFNFHRSRSKKLSYGQYYNYSYSHYYDESMPS